MIHKYRAWVKGVAMADWDTILKECDRFSLLDYPDFVFMQFTGRSDKNGVEIYHKDKLKSGRTGLIYIVEWNNESASFTSLCTEPEKDFCMNPYAWGEAEVVGNDYEGEQP